MATLNISDEIWAYINRNDYIFHNYKHFKDGGYLDESSSYFQNRFQDSLSTLQQRAAQSQLETLDANEAAVLINLLGEIQSGNVLDEALIAMGNNLDDLVQQFYNSSVDGQTAKEAIQAIRTKKASYKNLFANGKTSDTDLNSFFNVILKSLNAMGEIDQDILNGFTQIGQRLSVNGKNFLMMVDDSIGIVKSATEEDHTKAKEIINLLNSAAAILDSKGTITSQTFNAILTDIFNNTIGESLAKYILEKALSDIDKVVMTALTTNIDKNVKVINANFELTGKDTVNIGDKTTVAKSDLANTSAFKFGVSTLNDSTFEITLQSNISVKFNKQGSRTVKIVDSTPFRDIYMMDGNKEGFWAYNIMAHRKSPGFNSSYLALRSSVAAQFLNDWISGSGAELRGGKDRVQFLFINGRIYSIAEILAAACTSMNDKGSSRGIVSLSMAGRDSSINTWVGGNDPNIDDAIRRSEATKKAINDMVITATLNQNWLAAMTGKTGI